MLHECCLIDARNSRTRGLPALCLRPDADPDVVLDLIYGPAYHRLLQTHLPLSDRFTQAVVDTVVAGVRSGQLADGKSKKA